MFGIGAKEGLDRTDAAVIAGWFWQAILGMLVGVLILALGLWALHRSWGFLTFAFGLWFSLCCALRAVYLGFHFRRSSRSGPLRAPTAKS